MNRRTVARLSVAATMAAAPIGLLAAPAAAAQHAPLCGAFNMVEASPSFYSGAVSDGMDIAMTVNTLNGQGSNGDTGMFNAVALSSNAASPGCQS